MSNLIENPILDQHGSKPHGMRSLSPGDISPIDAITGRQKIDPRLGALAVPFLIAWGVACGEAAGGRGGTEPSTPTPIVEPTKTPTMIPTPDARATATAVAQEKLIPEIVALIGEPTGYRPATKEEINLYGGNPPPIERPGVKRDTQNNLQIPTYSSDSLLGQLDRIEVKKYYPEDMILGRGQTIKRLMGQLERVFLKIRSRDFKGAKAMLQSTLWDGIEKMSFFDKSSYKDGELLSNPDTNNDGISDWFESVYRWIKTILGRLG